MAEVQFGRRENSSWYIKIDLANSKDSCKTNGMVSVADQEDYPESFVD